MQKIFLSLPDIFLVPLKHSLTPSAYLNENLDCLYANRAFCALFHDANDFLTLNSRAKEFFKKECFKDEHFIAQERIPNIFDLVPTLKSEGRTEDLFQAYLRTAKEEGFCQFPCFHEDIHHYIRQLIVVFHYVCHEGQDLFLCQLMDWRESPMQTQNIQEAQKPNSKSNPTSNPSSNPSSNLIGEEVLNPEKNSGMRFTQNLDLIKSIPLFAHGWNEDLKEFDFGKACEMYQVMNDRMPICSYLFAPDYTMKDCNQEVARMLKTTKENFLVNFRDFLPSHQPDGTPSMEKARFLYQETLKTGYSRFEWTFINADGESIPTDLTFYKINYLDQEMLAAFAIDLRETKAYIKQIETHLAEQYERDKIILDSLPICAVYWNEEHEIIACNNEVFKLFKVPDLEYYKKNFKKFFPPVFADGRNSQVAVQNTLKIAFETGYHRGEFERIDNEGNILHVDVTCVRYEQGGKRYVAVYTVDLTSIKKRDEAIEEANARTNLMLNTFPIGATLWNKDFIALDCNVEVINMIGYSSKEEYLDYAHTLNPENLPKGREYYKAFFEAITHAFESGYERFEWATKHKSGESIPVEVTAIRVKHHKEDAVVVYTRDIRRQKKMLSEIEAANARTQIMLNTFPMGANYWNKDLQIIDCNLEMIKLVGYHSKEEYIQHFSKPAKYFLPEGREYDAKIFETVSKAFISGYEQIEWVTKHKDGYDIPVERTFIRVQNEKGEDFIIGYLRDLREQKKMLQELIDVQEDLREVKEIAENNANIKGEFLAHMSHEIRTPMNGIIGLIHLLLNSNLVGVQEEYAQKTLDSATHLLRVVNDILDLSSFEKGKIKMEKVGFSLDEVCVHVEDLFKAKALDKGLTFNIHRGKSTDGRIFGDPFRLKQALFNLIGNAIKFTEKGGINVDIQLKEITDTQKTFLFKVTDTGIGITEEQISRLFCAFSQAEAFITRKYGGTGLGLLLAKNIVEAMHGEIWVESMYGKSSTFSFYVSFELFEESKVKEEASNLAYQRYKIPEKLHNLESNAKQSVLIVEDNKINQLITRELLKKHGYRTELAENGEVALEMIQKEPFDIVLMDIQMPVMDGLTATKELRKLQEYNDLPVIAVSAHTMHGDKEICLEAGMDGYVRKPISPPELLMEMERLLPKKE